MMGAPRSWCGYDGSSPDAPAPFSAWVRVMAPQGGPPGERISGLEAKFDAYERYSHERWHQLANDLQPLSGLPLQLTRDIAKLEARLEAKIDGRLADIDRRLTAIETQRQQLTGARQLGVWLVQTVISALAVLVAIKGGVR
jgi:hypothetical protein